MEQQKSLNDVSPRRLVSVPSAARYAGVSERTVKRRIESQELTEYRLGTRIVRVDLDEIDALLSAHCR